jgi:alanine racemase
MRPTRVEVDADSIAHNVSFVANVVAPTTVCAVVKADGYGHGAVVVARAALRGGASWLAVALVEEAAQLREAGIDAPILVLSECRPDAMRAARDLDVRMTEYSVDGIAAAANTVAGPSQGGHRDAPRRRIARCDRRSGSSDRPRAGARTRSAVDALCRRR